MSSLCSTCVARPRPRFECPPTTSSGCSSAAAQVTTSPTCLASVTRNAFIALVLLEAWEVGKAYLSPMDMHPSEFRTAAELREDLAGIEQRAGIKSAFETLLLIEVNLIEHRTHQ